MVLGERPNASSDPLDDPVLRSYSRCLAVDILCVWRRVAAPKPEPDQPGNLFEISLSGTGNSGSVVHPPLSLTAAKELWIFWYGEEPDLTDLLAPELLKSSGKFYYIGFFFNNSCLHDRSGFLLLKYTEIKFERRKVFFVAFYLLHILTYYKRS